MKKCMITITEVLDNKTCQTMVMDISEDTISVNCPENTGIEVESVNRGSHFELIFKLPHIDQELHFQCKKSHMSEIPEGDKLDATLALYAEAYPPLYCQLAA